MTQHLLNSVNKFYNLRLTEKAVLSMAHDSLLAPLHWSLAGPSSSLDGHILKQLDYRKGFCMTSWKSVDCHLPRGTSQCLAWMN